MHRRLSCPMTARLDVPAVAAHLGLSVAEVRYLVRHQRIPYVRVGHRAYFDRRRVHAWATANPNALDRGQDTSGHANGNASGTEAR